MRRDVFQAIADPTRRQIINMVAHQSLNLNSVAQQFDVSRPAISKHIKILTECGLVTIKQKGRERFCEAKVEKLTEVSDWVEQFREMWETKFDSLDNYLAEIQEKPQKEVVPTEEQVVDTSEKREAPTTQQVEAPKEAPVEEKKALSRDIPEFLQTKKKKKAKKKKPVITTKAKETKPKKKEKIAELKEEAPEVAPNQYSLF